MNAAGLVWHNPYTNAYDVPLCILPGCHLVPHTSNDFFQISSIPRFSLTQLYVYKLGCPLIPKGARAKAPAGHNKPISQCSCSACEVGVEGFEGAFGVLFPLARP
jgi:hypothetical protein